jgi:hypothetical protein
MKMAEKQFINYYECPFDGEEWADVWSCGCNDMCPKCRTKDIEPYRSEEVVHANVRRREPKRKRLHQPVASRSQTKPHPE